MSSSGVVSGIPAGIISTSSTTREHPAQPCRSRVGNSLLRNRVGWLYRQDTADWKPAISDRAAVSEFGRSWTDTLAGRLDRCV